MTCTKGPSGASGPSGISGISGISGVSGVSGPSGFSFPGISGVSGVSGISGVSGVSGAQGISGVSGMSGVSGISGPSGVYDPTTALTLGSTLSVGTTLTVSSSSATTSVSGNVSTNTFSTPRMAMSEVIQTYTTTDLQNMKTTPVQVLAAQGSNTIIWPQYINVIYNLNTTGFTITNNDMVQFYFDGASGPSGEQGSPLVLGQFRARNSAGESGFASNVSSYVWEPIIGLSVAATLSTAGIKYPSGQLPGGGYALYINQPLLMKNTLAAWTGGDGSMQVNLQYSVLSM